MVTVSLKSENIVSHWLCSNITPVVTNRIFALKPILAGLYLGAQLPVLSRTTAWSAQRSRKSL